MATLMRELATGDVLALRVTEEGAIATLINVMELKPSFPRQ